VRWEKTSNNPHLTNWFCRIGLDLNHFVTRSKVMNQRTKTE